jgi:hypothetical protein
MPAWLWPAGLLAAGLAWLLSLCWRAPYDPHDPATPEER